MNNTDYKTAHCTIPCLSYTPITNMIVQLVTVVRCGKYKHIYIYVCVCVCVCVCVTLESNFVRVCKAYNIIWKAAASV